MITKDTPLQEILKLAPPCNCEQCKHGCRMGSGFLAEGDKEKIASFLKIKDVDTQLEEVEMFNKKLQRPRSVRKDKPYGRCTFFDEEKGCVIHAVKPLQCKIAMGCKEYGEELTTWFMLNHIVDVNDPESIRQYALYLRSGGKLIEGGKLDQLIPNKEKLQNMMDHGKN